MNPLEYIAISLPYWREYIAFVLLFLLLHWPMMRRWSVGIFDPLLLILLSNAFGWAIVWFMYARGDITIVYVATFSVAQIAYYVGLGTGRLHLGRGNINRRIRDDRAMGKSTFICSTLVNVVSTCMTWMIAGVPLFRDSRLGAFEGSGGLGLIERLADASSILSIFSAVFVVIRYKNIRRNLFIYLFFLWYLFSTAMSGSKGALLTMGQYIISVMFMYTSLRSAKEKFWGGRTGKYAVFLSIVFAIAVLSVQQSSDWASAALALVYRIVSYGDVYIFAYPDATIESLKGSNPLIGMFGGFLSTFRLFPQDALYPNLGYQFTGIIFPDLDLIVGPNPQHPIFGYHYFGWFGFMFSFVLGIVTSRLQRRLYEVTQHTFLGGLAAFVLYFVFVGVSVDFEYTMSKLASLIIGSALVLGLALVMNLRSVPYLRRRNSLAVQRKSRISSA